MTPNIDQTVREIAIENPATVRVFESLGIDYCCGGRRPLKEACERANIPLDRIMELLAKADESDPEDSRRWSDASLSDLTGHIVARHHAFVRQEVPRLEGLLDKVVTRHGEAHPELLSIQKLFAAMAQELTTHMLKEEQVLFPYLEKMEAAVRESGTVPPAFFGSLQNPIARMLADHDDAGELTSKIRHLSANYQAPESACPSYRGLYRGLADFERDLHRHVHLENNILFPRAIDTERKHQGYTHERSQPTCIL